MIEGSDWVETTVAEVVSRIFSGPSPTCEERNVRGDEWGVFKTTCSTWQAGWDWTKHKVLPREYWGLSRSQVQRGDTVITKAGPRHRVGVPSFVSEVPDRLIVSGKMIGVRPLQQRINPHFLALALADPRTQRFLDERTTGMAESQVNFENEALLKAPIWLPPTLREQSAIATVAEDCDALLRGLDVLIAKKRDIAAGVRQALLSGSKRLPRFAEPWVTHMLPDVAENLDSRRVPVNEVDRERRGGTYPYCGANGVVGRIDGYLFDEEIVLLAEDGGQFDQWMSRPIAYRMREKCWVNNHAHVLRAKPGFSQDFLFQSLKHKDLTGLVTSGTRSKLTQQAMRKIEFIGPSSFDEQAAMAEVLSDLDAELDALVARREKTALVKQGMMDELLTGRTRLV